MTYVSKEDTERFYKQSHSIISAIFDKHGVKSSSGYAFGVLNCKTPVFSPSNKPIYQDAISSVMPIPAEMADAVLDEIAILHSDQNTPVSKTTIHMCSIDTEDSTKHNHTIWYGPNAKLK